MFYNLKLKLKKCNNSTHSLTQAQDMLMFVRNRVYVCPAGIGLELVPREELIYNELQEKFRTLLEHSDKSIFNPEELILSTQCKDQWYGYCCVTTSSSCPGVGHLSLAFISHQ
jgi:hypothetical protein